MLYKIIITITIIRSIIKNTSVNNFIIYYSFPEPATAPIAAEPGLILPTRSDAALRFPARFGSVAVFLAYIAPTIAAITTPAPITQPPITKYFIISVFKPDFLVELSSFISAIFVSAFLSVVFLVSYSLPFYNSVYCAIIFS